MWSPQDIVYDLYPHPRTIIDETFSLITVLVKKKSPPMNPQNEAVSARISIYICKTDDYGQEDVEPEDKILNEKMRFWIEAMN